ncbi:ferredoxin reductase family protein [Spirochaeta lutea]|uniref:FAD-binding FR-type domain-containing protein n=1 Tax=Spirochaeta lutea TaxID=1480694 RepID=A0A098QW16_9SPIO|nr:ferredoxin reductase family protein [Spirochaeta lutea]KGE71603.1 hypothetical protein DC28_10015 [Spirochaeta lutea]
MKRSIITLVLAGLLVLAAASLFLDSQGNFSLLYEGKRLMGLFAMVLLTFQVFLASRLPLLERGFGQDRLLGYHRLVGIGVLVTALIHGVFDIIFQLSVYGSLMLYFPGDLPKLLGSFTLVLLLLVAIPALLRGSIAISYDSWRRIHRIGFFLVPLMLIHSLVLGTTIRYQPLALALWIGCAGLYGVSLGYRLVIQIRKNRDPYLVESVHRETHDVVSIRAAGKRKDFLPGQFMLVQIKKAGKKSPVHPFTISAPPSSEELRFSVKAIGDFSGEDIPDLTVGDELVLEGPYGWFSHVRFPLSAPLLFIAGGIGITPFLSMLAFLAEHDPDRRVMLVWGNKEPKDAGFQDELVRYKSSMRALSVLHVFSHSTDNHEVLSDPWVSGFVTTELLNTRLTDLDSWGVMLCGPPVMMKKLVPDLLAAGVEKKNLLYERFDF